MAEPPLKKQKPSASGLSAFAAMASRRNFQPENGNQGNKKFTNTEARADPQNNSNRASSKAIEPDRSRRDPQAQTSRKYASQLKKSDECLSKASNTLELAVQDIQRLKLLLFPYALDYTGDVDVPSEVVERGIESTAELDDSIKHKTRWRIGQEQAVGEIFSLAGKGFSTESRTNADADGILKTRPMPFVRATADLICATLSDHDAESTLEWETFFRSLHTASAIAVENDTAHKAEPEVSSIIQPESTSEANRTHLIGTTKDEERVEQSSFSSQSYTARATYAMAWIRFVNAFADRDVRNPKASRQVAIPNTQNTAQQEPTLESRDEEEYVAATRPGPSSTNPTEAVRNGSSESLPSFLSLNPYAVLSLPRDEEYTPGLSNLEPGEMSADERGNRRTRNEGTMYAQASLIDMPLDFVDVRHQCVHDEDIPPLDGELGLKRMVKRGLRWVWERYWKELDAPAT